MKTKKSYLERTNPQHFIIKCVLGLLILIGFVCSFKLLEIIFGLVPTIIITIALVILTLFLIYWNKVYGGTNQNE